ncbi:phage tail tape measure protein, TP901 family [Alkaliphilus metalliredigens QYMF]|uniref:Phage tail tape measure protein, TP901 family n=1 Tax=Alkaliphilus metalliredigens (strain QYMF) TaxID=293826 RepID=A6TR98_ALKMQ|nr:phage tail tape measure protein [Alkaliphilus metalliredigens]ABR48716.1 phage tail tape measure protein, TP901 family [Alkaliphilus metalliredigens QYMF]
MSEREIYRLEVNVGISGDRETTNRLSAMDKYTQRSESRMRQLDRMDANPAVRLNDKLSSPLKKVEGRIGSFAKKAVKRFSAVAMAGTLLIGGFGLSNTIQTFADFEQGMKNVQATTMATEEEMAILTDTAKELGKTTAFSAKEASEGMNYLGMAGFETNEIIEAMPGLLDLAAASGTDLGRTADIVSDALTAFGMSAQETTHLADVMAKASSTANTNVEMLGESFKYAAAPATAFGMSAEETTAALAMMANAGIKGSQAGTSLRGALTRLSKPTKESQKWLDKLGVSVADADGNMRPFNDIMGDMRGSMADLTQEQQQQAMASIFGQEAMSGMLAVINTSTEDFDEYTQSLINAEGAAKEMADIKLDSLSGQFTILKSAVEGMKIELGERLAPYAKDFVTWFTAKIPDITEKIVELVDRTIEFGTKAYPYVQKLIGLLKQFSPVLIGIAAGFAAFKIGTIIAGAIASVKGFIVAAKGMTLVAGGLGKGLLALMGPVGWVALAIGALVTAGVLLWKNWDTVKEKASQLGSWIKESWTATVEWFKELPGRLFNRGVEMFTSLKDGIVSLMSSAVNASKEVGKGVVNAVTDIPGQMLEIGKNIMKGLANGIKSAVTAPVKAARNAASSVAGGIKDRLKINSPSKLTTEYGEFTTEGLAVGIKDKIPQLQTAINNVHKVVTDDEMATKEPLLKSFIEMSLPKSEKLKEMPMFQKVIEKTKEIRSNISKVTGEEKPKKAQPVAVAGGGGATYYINIDNVDVDVSSSGKDGDGEDIHEVVQAAQEEFGRKLLEALKDKK